MPSILPELRRLNYSRPQIEAQFTGLYHHAQALDPERAEIPRSTGVQGFVLTDHLNEGFFTASFCGKTVTFRLQLLLSSSGDACGLVTCEVSSKLPGQADEIARLVVQSNGLVTLLGKLAVPELSDPKSLECIDFETAPLIVAHVMRLALQL